MLSIKKLGVGNQRDCLLSISGSSSLVQPLLRLQDNILARSQREEVTQLEEANPKKAPEKAHQVLELRYRARVLTRVARFTDGDPVTSAVQAAKAASESDDDCKRSAYRARRAALA